MSLVRHDRLLPFVACCALLLAPGGVRGASSDPQRALTDALSVKAGFLLNFAAFVEWPADAFQSPSDPLVICVYGDDPFGQRLESTFGSETVQGRRIAVRRIGRGRPFDGCHILFIADSERARLPWVMPAARTRPILTVADAPEFNELGGIIEFATEHGRVGFRINRDAAREAGLVISSRLLRLAEGE